MSLSYILKQNSEIVVIISNLFFETKEVKMVRCGVFFLLVLAVISLAGCSALGSEGSISGPIWLLADLNGEPVQTGTVITAEFTEDGRVSGSGGCNSYNTTYELSRDNIEFGEQIATTLMACPDPVMEQERAYLEALSNTNQFEITGDELVLYNDDGVELARFVAVDQGLAGSSWNVIAYNNGKEAVVSVINGTEITAEFDQDGQLTGSAGCNSYFASYETDDDAIRIGPVGSTRMACSEPEGIMEQEQQYLAALELADTYKIDGMNMEMRAADGALVANFRRSAEP